MAEKQVGKVVLELRLNDVVRLRKQHPCGSLDWRVVRLGADIGIKCCKCGRRVLLPRRVLERRVKSFVSRGVAGEDDNLASETESRRTAKG
jgi:hypothetical protein